MEECIVSVICAAYNHGRYIRQTLEGFVMQKTNFQFEVLISDDASTDNTAEIIKEYEKKYPDIIKPTYYTENQHSKGNAPSLNMIKNATSKYIAICEGDDFWIDENKLQIQVDHMENNPNCVYCAHSGYNCHEDGVIKRNMFRPYKESRIVPTEDIMSKWLFPTASVMYRREVRTDYPIPYRGNCRSGDFITITYFAQKGKVYYIDRPMCVYRNNSLSSTSLKAKKVLKSALKITQNFLKCLKDLTNIPAINIIIQFKIT